METSITQKNSPITVQLEVGKTYAWCSCGNSSNQPFCDGSHAGTEHRPVVFKAQKSKAILCNCKKSQGAPFCDGFHSRIEE